MNKNEASISKDNNNGPKNESVQSTSNSKGDQPIEILCPDCDHKVPQQNMPLHQATSCGKHRVGTANRESVQPLDMTSPPSSPPIQIERARTGFSPPRSRLKIEEGIQDLSSSQPLDKSSGSNDSDVYPAGIASSSLRSANLTERNRSRLDASSNLESYASQPIFVNDAPASVSPMNLLDSSVEIVENPNIRESCEDVTALDVSDSIVTSTGIRRRHGKRNNRSVNTLDSEVTHVGDVVNLADNDNDENESVEVEWSCPRCTLLNSMDDQICNACGYGNQVNRRPDATRRERLIGTRENIMTRGDGMDFISFAGMLGDSYRVGNNEGTTDNVGSNGTNRTGAYVGGGALLGSVLGGIRAYANGNSVSNGAFEGAVGGAVGGAIVNSAIGSSTHASTNNSSSRNSNQTRATGNYPRNRQDRGSQITSSVRRINTRRSSPADLHADILRDLVRSMFLSHDNGMRVGLPGYGMLQHPFAEGEDVDDMSYDRLLEIFGDGSENRGADETAISSLPTSTLSNVDTELPEDRRQCTICLENFENGDKRRILPCLHGFHNKCIDTWLKSNASCPICKHELNS